MSQKNLIKLLTKHGYSCDENGFGYKIFRRDGCRNVELYPQANKAACERFTRQVQADVTPHVPESEWEATERHRAEDQKLRAAADAARVKKTRLGGLAAILTEMEIDRVVARAEQDLAGLRFMDRLIRERPLGAGRKS